MLFRIQGPRSYRMSNRNPLRAICGTSERPPLFGRSTHSQTHGTGPITVEEENSEDAVPYPRTPIVAHEQPKPAPGELRHQ